VEFAGHGEIRTGSRNEGVTEEADAVEGEEAEIEAFQEWERAEKINEHADGEIGNEEHVAEAERLGEKRADVRFEAKAEIFTDERVIDVTKRGIEKRAAMDGGNDRGHVHVGDVHDDGVVEKTETPRPFARDTNGKIDEENSNEEEGKVEKGERAEEAGGSGEAEPGNEDEELEDVFVGQEAERATKKRDSLLRSE
jgi:hypothetical protein